MGKQHQRGPKRALLGQREPVVNEMNRWLIPRELLGYEAEGKNWPASQREVHPTTVTYSSKPSSGERCEKTAGERVGAKERHLPGITAPGRAGRYGLFARGQNLKK